VNINDKPGDGWQESAPSELATTTETGWGDQDQPATTTTTTEGEWDALNQATIENAPTGTASHAVEVKAKEIEKEKEKEKKFEKSQKTFDDYLKEKQEKSKELANLLAHHNIPTPVPRNIVEQEEAGGRYFDNQKKVEKVEPPKKKPEKEKEKPKKPVSEPSTLSPTDLRNSLFNFAADPREVRRRFNQDSEIEERDPKEKKNNPKPQTNPPENPSVPNDSNTPELNNSAPNNENPPPAENPRGNKGGRRGNRGGGSGRGGQGRGGGRGGRRFNSAGRAFNRGGNGGNIFPAQPEEWPELN